MSQGGVISIPSNVAESFVANIGSAAPSGGILNIVGGTGITTSATGNTITITNTQTSTLTFQTAGGNAVSSAGAITFTGAGGLAFSGAGSTVTGTLSAIPNASLANSAVTINVSNGLTGGGSVSLGGSVNIVGSGTPAPTSGNLVLIQSQTASSSSALNFTTGLTGFNNYYLTFNQVTGSSNGGNLYIQFSTNGGSSYSSSGYITTGWTSLEGTGLSNIDETNLVGSLCTFGADFEFGAEFPFDGNAQLFNLNSSVYAKNMLISSIGIASGHAVSNQINTQWQVATAANALRVFFDVGNILTGIFKLYGVVN
jgi:hypothetical protein